CSLYRRVRALPAAVALDQQACPRSSRRGGPSGDGNLPTHLAPRLLHLTTELRPCTPLGPFFFQAEDGIRDPLVTGVQTCALPIYRPHAAASRNRGGRTVFGRGCGCTHSGDFSCIRRKFTPLQANFLVSGVSGWCRDRKSVV